MLSTTQTTSSRILGRLGVIKQTPARQGLIVHALHKSASMFLYKFFADLCRRQDVPLYSIHNANPDQQQAPADIATAFVSGPIRSFKTTGLDYPNLDNVTHLIQVRDPRDIIVSEYFSLGWIHSDKGWADEEKQRRQNIQNVAIDEFAIREAEFSRYPLIDRYAPILDLTGKPNVAVVRYEDMVLDFGTWLGTVLIAAQVRPLSAWRSRLQRQYRDEFRPGGDKDPHKRNVLPGDHRIKLHADTIEQLNKQFAPILDRLGYAQKS